jgi:uncharacterized membrane protein YkgB
MDGQVQQIQRERDYWRQEAETLAAQLDRREGEPTATLSQVDLELTASEPATVTLGSSPLERFAAWLGRTSITTLRVALGLVFLGFGLLKFFPDVSPAEDIAQRTVDKLTFGFITGDTARILVAIVEVGIGLCLVTGKFLSVGLVLLALAAVGILAPLVLFPDELFGGEYHAPTLLGQYVLKDIVLLAAGMVVMARVVLDQALKSRDR